MGDTGESAHAPNCSADTTTLGEYRRIPAPVELYTRVMQARRVLVDEEDGHDLQSLEITEKHPDEPAINFMTGSPPTYRTRAPRRTPP